MIREEDIIEAIAECQGVRNPSSSTCIRLAAFYTILDHLRGNDNNYSFSAFPTNQAEDKVTYLGDSEFAQTIYGKDSNEMWSIMDELMETLQVIDSRLYDSVMRKI